MFSALDIQKRCNGRPVNISSEAAFSSLAADSRDVRPGALFVAVQGHAANGHAFIEEAFNRGAQAAVVETEEALSGKPGFVVESSRIALSALAAFFAGDPSRRMFTIGVTGTNGKTTTHWMISELLRLLGRSILRVGTLGIDGPNIEVDLSLTTPGPIALHELFATALGNGCEFVVMEASSHALHQHRIDDVSFDVGVFTNLTRDHLDYHDTMTEYGAAKAMLFHLVGTSGKRARTAIINCLDDWSAVMTEAARKSGCAVVSTAFEKAADLRIESFSQSIRGSHFALHLGHEVFKITSPFIGRYNAENLSAALAAAMCAGYDAESLVPLIEKIRQVPGRLEACGTKEVGVYVDYAHTPDALENSLRALRPITTGALWVVFGCGGDRDRGKRPLMASVATAHADHVVVTSDNPRTEDPAKIVAEILSNGCAATIVEVDRRAAIEATLSRAQSGDVILIAGKGHENYQIIGTTKLPFSDQAIVTDFYRRAAA